MFRMIWFGLCVVVAILLAVISQSVIPFLTSSLSPDGISHGIYDLLNRSSLIRFAISFGLFGVFMTALCLGGQVLVDAIASHRFHRDLEDMRAKAKPDAPIRLKDFADLATEAGDLAEPGRDYAASANAQDANTIFKVPLPSDRFFGFQNQVQSRLHLWLFNAMPGALVGIGLVLLFLSLVAGVDDMLFRSQISSQQPISGLLRPLQVGFLALAITLMSSVVIKFAVRFLVHLRSSQTECLTSLLDSLFLRQTAGEPDALRQPLKVLSDAQVLIAEDRTEQMGKVVNDALKLLTDRLAGEFNKQVKSTSKLLEETEKQVTKSTVAVQEAHNTLSKYARGQSAAIDKALGAGLKNHLRSDDKARAELTKTLDKAVKGLDQTLQASAKSTTQLFEGSLTRLDKQFGEGLADTAENLKATQADIARLVSAVEKLATRPVEVHTPKGAAKEEYLRLVGEDDAALDTPPLGDLSLDGDAEGDVNRASKLKDTLKRGGANRPKKSGGNKLTDALKDLKEGSNPKDLPDL